MSDVTLSVGGRNYTIACTPGDEDRVRGLAATIDEKLAALGMRLTNPMEAKNLLIAGLILADELDEANRRAAQQSPQPASEYAEGLEALADRLEDVARHLEDGAQAH